MISSEKISGKNIKTTPLELGNDWSGRVVLSPTRFARQSEAGGGAHAKNFSKTDWTDCLSKPELLFENVEKILKTEDQNCVAVKNLTVGSNRLKVVIKRHYRRAGLRQFFRSFQSGRALRNFKTAVKLLRCRIPAASPLAAIHQRKNLLTKQSIYITEYFENGTNLYAFASEQLSKITADHFALKKHLCHQLAAILAELHKNGLWHRDSKATNFTVYKNARGEYKILLTDMDGIKRYFLRRKSRQFRSLWQLAASLMSVSAVNRTDYLRTFTAYCNILCHEQRRGNRRVGLELPRRRRIFLELVSRAKAKHNLSFLRKQESKSLKTV